MLNSIKTMGIGFVIELFASWALDIEHLNLASDVILNPL